MKKVGIFLACVVCLIVGLALGVTRTSWWYLVPPTVQQNFAALKQPLPDLYRDPLSFKVDAISSTDGIEQSIYATLPDGSQQKVADYSQLFTPNAFNKTQTNYFDAFITGVPTTSRFAFSTMNDIDYVNGAPIGQLFAFDKQNLRIAPVDAPSPGSYPYFFSPNFQYLAQYGVSDAAIDDIGRVIGGRPYVDIIDLDTMSIVTRYVPPVPEMLAFNYDSATSGAWVSPTDFAVRIFANSETATSFDEQFSTDTIHVLPAAALSSLPSSTKQFIWDQGNDTLFALAATDTYVGVQSHFSALLPPSDLGLPTVSNVFPSTYVMNAVTGSPYLLLTNVDHPQIIRAVIDTRTWTAVTGDQLPPSLAASSNARRDMFVSPNGRYAVGLDEQTAVVVDLVHLKEIKTVPMPSGFMAYKNNNGVIIFDTNPTADPVGGIPWSSVDPGTHWTTPTTFKIVLYRIKNGETTKPSSSMVITMPK